ncbi:MAG: sulfatase-like hydrolase/transferase [Clostridiales bacterium]|nr:sulfatase-like hydrolase/transferase [Clostridiales bacterium]
MSETQDAKSEIQDAIGEIQEITDAKEPVKKPSASVPKKVNEYQPIWVSMLTMLWLPAVTVLFELCFALLIRYPFSVYTAWLSLSAAAGITALILLVPKKTFRYVAIGTVTHILTLVYVSQYIYFRIFGTIFVWASLSSGGAGAVVEYFAVVCSAMADGWWGILILLAPSILYWPLVKKYVGKIPAPSMKYPATAICTFLVITILGRVLIINDRKGAANPRRLFLTEFSQDASLRRFGLLPTMGLDFRMNILELSLDEKTSVDVGGLVIETLSPEEKEAIGMHAVSQTTTPVPTADPTQEPEATPTSAPEPTATPTPYPKNVLDIDFDLEADDSTYRHMNEFFSQRQPTTMNEYTGLFEGKNLILITAEAFSGYVIDPELTPTLYKLSTEGFVFNHFYTPIWYVSTSDGEFVETTGLIPKSGVWSYTKIANNYMPFAFGNQFQALGYQTYAFHNNTYTYYHRDRSYPTMGYTYYGLGNGLEVEKLWPESDVEMIEKSVGYYLDGSGKPFHAYYMTVSGHLQYAFGDNQMSSKHRDLVEDLEYCTAVRAYIACQIELDRALERLLSELEAAGELENTVIALGADHYPYGLENSEYSELTGKSMTEPFTLYENTFILWSGDMTEPVVVDKYCSSLDIAPTLANLFGLPYDSRLYIGTDIFAPEPNYVIFDDRSFINDKIMYNARNGKVTALVDEEISEEYVKECIEYVSELFWNSAHIIDKDYYGYLFPDGVPWEQQG